MINRCQGNESSRDLVRTPHAVHQGWIALTNKDFTSSFISFMQM